MSLVEESNIRGVLLDEGDFGAPQVEQLRSALGSSQLTDVRHELTELERRIEQGDRSTRNLVAAGVASYLMGRHQAAENYLADVTGNGLAAYYRGEVLLTLERFAEAAESFEQAAKLGHDPVHSTLSRAGALRLAGQLDEAEQVLRSTGRDGAARAEYSYQMGCLRSDRGDRFGAVEYFERAVDMDPYHGPALFRLAGENNILGNDREAIELYERSLSRPPLFLGALINLGLLYEDIENYSAAAFCFRRVLEAYPNHPRARLYLRDIEATGDMYYDDDALRRQRDLDVLLRTPITDFELSARARNGLERAGIQTLGDLTRMTEDDLLAGRNFGETSLREIGAMLASRGLRMGQTAPSAAARAAAPAFVAEELSPQERAQMQSPVTDLNLSVRARKCLSRLGITTIGELVTKSADELMSVRNFGVTSLNEIRTKLAERDLKLRNE